MRQTKAFPVLSLNAPQSQRWHLKANYHKEEGELSLFTLVCDVGENKAFRTGTNLSCNKPKVNIR